MQQNQSPSENDIFSTSSLLAELEGEATQKMRARQTEELDHQTRSQNLHRGLEQLFQFFNQFSAHLNKITPAIPRSYSIDQQVMCTSLQWQESGTDYRKQSLSENALLDHVLFRVRLMAQSMAPVTRRWYEVESLKKELHAYGLRTVADLDELVRTKPQREFFEADLAPDFVMRIQFQGNYDTGQIDLLCNNFDSFGLTSFTLQPEDVTPQLLDEMGRYILGRQHDLPEKLSRARQPSPASASR
jgi:hypothetical protein